MALHLVCVELPVSHEVLIIPQEFKIAGLVPGLCDHKDMGLAIQTYAVPMVGYPEDIKLVLRLTDGTCTSLYCIARACSSSAQATKGGVSPLGNTEW